MERVFIWYTILNLAIIGFVLLCVRASRARSVPNERQDLEENRLTGTDWELVRRERCLPTGCPRARGHPPRPRKDVTCEVCAATYLDVRLQRLLSAPGAPEPGVESSRTLETRSGPAGAPCAPALAASRPAGRGLAGVKRGSSGSERRRAASHRWGLPCFGLGLLCVAAGAVIAISGRRFGSVVSGYLMVLCGLGLLVSSLTSDGI